jgi:hypothetical protein
MGVKGGRRVLLTTLPPSVSRFSRQNVGTSTSHNPMGLHGLLQALPLAFTTQYQQLILYFHPGFLGFWTLSIIRDSKEHNVSGIGSASIFR